MKKSKKCLKKCHFLTERLFFVKEICIIIMEHGVPNNPTKVKINIYRSKKQKLSHFVF